MKITPLLLLALLAFAALAAVPKLTANSWPAWRGDLAGSGEAKEASPPLEWGREKNVRWRFALPEAGNSTPIVVGDRVFVTQAVTAESWRGLICLDRKTGKQLWRKGLVYDKPERTHNTNPYCSPSPATDGAIVVAAYGSAGVAAYDLEGKELWHRDLGPVDHAWGSSSSPLLFEDLCIVYHGPGTGAGLYALDKATGKTVWKWEEPTWDTAGRKDGFAGKDDGIVGSFSTPILVKAGDRDELVMSFPVELRAFDPRSGETLWTCGGLNPLVYTSPLADGEVVVAMGGYYGNSLAVRAGGSGEVASTRRLWQKERHNGGIGSGVVKDGRCYYQNSGGVAYCLDIESGEQLWEARLPGAGKSWGSFVLVGDRIYSLSQAGDTVVFLAKPDGLEVVAQSDLREHTNSSIVPVGDEIFIRTHEALWCLGAE
jgi:outer membrane protein assembly factor BamB